MGFLTPLYLLGALAVGLPILFHLIRRTPRGRQVFSTVMFLEPSPPRVTRRSRIEHWLLLLLRGLAICLLALAFARPFLREPAAADLFGAGGKQVAVLIDTSASMRREGVWDEARERLTEVLDEASPSDRFAVYTFDSSPRLRFDGESWLAVDPNQRAGAVESALEDVAPGWRETDLGRALSTVADSLMDESVDEERELVREIVVVSDLQSGSRLEALQAYTWPEEVVVRLVRVGEETARTNAGIQVVAGGESEASQLRVRVTNAADSERETFTVGWLDDFAAEPASEEESGTGSSKAMDVYVPPGQSRVVAAPEEPEGRVSSRLILRGDDHEFDNICYVSRTRRREVTIVYLGSDDPDDPEQQRYYVEPLFPDTSERDVRVVDWEFESAEMPTAENGVQLVLLAEQPRGDQIVRLREYLDSGGLIVFVPSGPDECAALYELAGVTPVAATEAEVDDYVMLTGVDFDHPVLAPFADPRYSDFTKLPFWRHRRVDLSPLEGARVLAQFDDGDPAIVEIPAGPGRVVFFASGWRRDDSQLAVWSKFVPLMNGLLDYGSGQMQQRAQFSVGEQIPLAALTAVRDAPFEMRSPDGSTVEIAAGARVATEPEEPGIYVLSGTAESPLEEVRFAVNLAASESRTDPLEDELLEAAGVKLAREDAEASDAGAVERERQLQNRELERQQKLWRWLILAAVLVLVAETLLSGRLSMRRPVAAE
ncbi:MAG: VWA domain-containing protein [Planctomycetota bacterium]|nr:MAG: VWA domain-containing protein [Planctomycetota bacterium]REK30455.1 MAG: VWA domain-containing protein [Planctomycetota bacterium]